MATKTHCTRDTRADPKWPLRYTGRETLAHHERNATQRTNVCLFAFCARVATQAHSCRCTHAPLCQTDKPTNQPNRQDNLPHASAAYRQRGGRKPRRKDRCARDATQKYPSTPSVHVAARNKTPCYRAQRRKRAICGRHYSASDADSAMTASTTAADSNSCQSKYCRKAGLFH